MDSYAEDKNGVKEIGFRDGKDFLQNIMFFEFRVTEGDEIKKEDELASVEGINGVLSLRSKAEGKVKELNHDIEESPEKLEDNPDTWLVRLE